eukprot:11265305-Karenia_brevis.AAC.1
MDVGPACTAKAFRALGRGRGVGHDEIPAELLQAGGDPLACKYSAINQRVLSNYSWPTQWRGGRMVDVFKKKGSAQDCDA